MNDALTLTCYLVLGLPMDWLVARSVARTALTPEQAQRSIYTFTAGVASYLFWAALFMSPDAVGIGFVGIVLESYLPTLIVLLNRMKPVTPPNDRIDDPVPRG